MKYLFFPLLLLLTFWVQAQEYPTNYFRHPLNIPISISGSFAEVRSNHFHSGVDYRVGGSVGAPVYAAADGYVSRIAISPWGGGKVLYIDHPNGYRTVYMHLNDFTGPIARWVRDFQYQNHCYAFYEYLPEGLIPVTKGQLVAHAGNTGSSGGPHLHFEVRKSANDETINPLYFGFKFTDVVDPIIRGIKLYPLNGKPQHLCGDTLTLPGPFYTGIYATDVCEAGPGKNGVEQIELYLDGALFFRYHNQSFLFEDTRAINAIIDYPHYLATGEYYILTRQLPNTPAPCHQPLRNQGWILLQDSNYHTLEYRVSDLKGHRVTRRFVVRNSQPCSQLVAPSLLTSYHAPTPMLHYYTDNLFTATDATLLIPENALYDEDSLLYSVTTAQGKNAPLSAIHTFQLAHHPLPPHRPLTLRLRIPKIADTAHLIIVNIKGNKRTAMTTQNIDGWLQTSIKSFGSYAIVRDNTPPTIRPVNFSNGRPLKSNQIKLRISDDLSGIQTYHCILNGSWILAEFDGKTATLTISTTTELHPGSNSLVVRLQDAAGNAHQEQYTILK